MSVSVVYCGFPASLLTLERAFPAEQRVDLDVLRARDRARHARILQGVVDGVVDFAVDGTSDPYLAGYSKFSWHSIVSFVVFIDYIFLMVFFLNEVESVFIREKRKW